MLVALLCCTTAGAAGSMRCDGKIVDPGMSLAHVVALCGTPEARVSREVPVRSRNRLGFSSLTGVTTTERLIYDRGEGRFPVELVFIDGELRRIEYLYQRR